MDRRDDMTNLLKREMVLAMGCTEPAACALSGAYAAKALGSLPEKIVVETTRDMLKNAMGVTIPGFHRKGVAAAVALGAAIAEPSLGLDILSTLNDAQKETAEKLEVDIKLVAADFPVSILVHATSGAHEATALVSGTHTHLSFLEKDGKILENDPPSLSSAKDDSWLTELTVRDIMAYADDLPLEVEKLLLSALRTNLQIAQESMMKNYGLSVGKTLMEGYHWPPESYDEALNVGAALAAGGSDARMAGCLLPVVINSGSGNQGLTLTVPIGVIGHYLKKTPHEIAQALCVAELTGLVLTAVKGRLSAQCGAFTAACGTGCGLCRLLGGSSQDLERVIRNMVGNLTGVICDGAKMTCALKIYSSVQAAYLACKLAMAGLAPGAESGIVGDDAKGTLAYLSELTHQGMEPTDKTILSIMLEKQQ